MNIKKWTTNEIRKTWLNFWVAKNHLVIFSKSLIPKNDKSLIWINSGVATLKKYFSGQENPPHNRLVSCQKSIRTNDIENVGLTSRHHTFFEMLGNFSIGEYFKKDAIDWAYELLTKVFQFNVNDLYITVYEQDDEAYQQWIKNGIIKNHIIKCDKERNFWDVGEGPCGPCTEIYYDRGEKYDLEKKGANLFFQNLENDRYVEIWNIVFSQFSNDGKNVYSELTRKNIDTGAGLERLACVLQDVPTNFDIDIYQPIIAKISKFTKFKYDQNVYFHPTKEQKEINHAYCVIADHIKASCFAIGDGVIPSNKERGYIIRKLIRRAMIYGHKLGISSNFLESIANCIIEVMSTHYSSLITKKNVIIDSINFEERLFKKTIEKGMKLFVQCIKTNKFISGENAFKLMDTYGFSLELTKELALANKVKIDLDAFNKLLLNQQNLSKNNNKSKAMLKQNSDLLNFKNSSNFFYDKFSLKGKIIGIFDHEFKKINEINSQGLYWIVLDNTCLYATSGGQIADKGNLVINGKIYHLLDCIKGVNLQHFHCVNITENELIKVNDDVVTNVDLNARKIIAAIHTSEHLLQKSLKNIVDKNIKQEGSLKTFNKGSFDFNYHKKLDNTQLNHVEAQINNWIKNDNKVTTELMSFIQAMEAKAIGYFEQVYSKIKSKLRVVKVDGITTEICGGTHVKSLKNIEEFHITKLIAKGSGNWRIEFICTKQLVNSIIASSNEEFLLKINNFKKLIISLKIDQHQIKEINEFKFAKTWDEYIANQNFIENLQKKINDLKIYHEKNNEINMINKYVNDFTLKIDSNKKQLFILENQTNKIAIAIAKTLVSKFDDKIFVILNLSKDNISYIVMKNDKATILESANSLVDLINKNCNGKGGGKNNFAQGCTILNQKNLEIIKKLI